MIFPKNLKGLSETKLHRASWESTFQHGGTASYKLPLAYADYPVHCGATNTERAAKASGSDLGSRTEKQAAREPPQTAIPAVSCVLSAVYCLQCTVCRMLSGVYCISRLYDKYVKVSGTRTSLHGIGQTIFFVS